MTIKSLLLGSAAAVAVVGGAQAADLSVAEPVEYVKVCDYFGAGYWYIPGTDTCIKISGFVEENAYFHTNEAVGSGITYSFGRFTFTANHSSTWDFTHVVQMDIDTKSETEYGVLEGLISFGNGGKGYSSYGLGSDGAFVSLGGFKAGAYQYGAFHPEYAFTDQNGPVYNDIYATFGYDALETVQMSWASGGISAAIGISDPSSSEFFNYGVGHPVAQSAPLITGNVGFGSKDVMFNIAGGYVTNDSGYGSSWGIDGHVNITLGPNDQLEGNAAFGDNAFTQTSAGNFNLGTNNGYSFLIGWQHNLSKTLTLALDGSWEKFSGNDDTAYAFSGDLIWSPVTNFSVIAAATYENNTYDSGEDSWAASLTARRSW